MYPRRRHRVNRFLTALVVFIATSAGLHAVARHQGWDMHHGWRHHLDHFCNDADSRTEPDAPAVVPGPGRSG